MNPVLVTDPASLSPLALFIHADWVVKIVMGGLLLASIWTWAIIISFWRRVGRTRREMRGFERDFWKADDIDAFYKAQADNELPSARVMAAGIAEWRRSTAGTGVDKVATRERLGTAMAAAAAGEVDRLSDRLNVLATVGSVAPFVGLFGTVWGIMDSFVGISRAHTSNLTVVAPGIAEALLATAIGLVAAIPAVVIFNGFARGIAGYRALLGDASAEVLRHLSRDLDRRDAMFRAARAAE